MPRPSHRPPGGGRHRWLSAVLLLLLALSSVSAAHSAPAPATPAATAETRGSFAVSPGQAKKLAYEGATLELGTKAVTKAMVITITALGQDDLPALDQGMANATAGPRRGYRFGPHNTRFGDKITVSLPYDPALIPEGLTADDLKTFFFDDQTGMWQELDRVKVDTRNRVVVSLSDHFTDMINAAVTVPDHAQPLSYNPNSLKDVQAAEPGAGIGLVGPPQASSQGDARLSYPIELPPGRQGMQPSLALAYSSSGGNGWVGLGWDLQAPAVAVDVRWGVPRYGVVPGLAGLRETETYLLGGEQLTPLAHRADVPPA